VDPSRDPDRGGRPPSRSDSLAGPVMTAGIVIAALGGVVLVIAAAISRAVLPAILGAIVFAAALGLGRWRARSQP
jgi:hypothetical protein